MELTPKPGMQMVHDWIAKHGGRVVNGAVTMSLPAMQEMLGDVTLYVCKICAAADTKLEEMKETAMKFDIETALPDTNLIRHWVEEQGGRIEGDTATIKVDGLKTMVSGISKTMGTALAKALPEMMARRDEEEEEGARSAKDPHAQVLVSLASMADSLVDMRQDFTDKEGWEPLLAEVERSLRAIRKTMVVACGRDE